MNNKILLYLIIYLTIPNSYIESLNLFLPLNKIAILDVNATAPILPIITIANSKTKNVQDLIKKIKFSI